MIGVVFHQGSRLSRGGHSSVHRSFGWSLISVVVHRVRLSSFITGGGGGSFISSSFIWGVSHQRGRSSGSSIIRVVVHHGEGGGGVVHQLIVQQGGRSSVNLSSEWSPIRVVAHQLIVQLIS